MKNELPHAREKLPKMARWQWHRMNRIIQTRNVHTLSAHVTLYGETTACECILHDNATTIYGNFFSVFSTLFWRWQTHPPHTHAQRSPFSTFIDWVAPHSKPCNFGKSTQASSQPNRQQRNTITSFLIIIKFTSAHRCREYVQPHTPTQTHHVRTLATR